MTNIPKTWFFDYDGTLVLDDHFVSPEISTAISKFWDKGGRTSIITARPFTRLKKLCPGYKKLVSSGMPIGVDRGARVVTTDGKDNLMHIPFVNEEIEEILKVIITYSKYINFIGFYPKNLSRESYMFFLTKDNALYRKSFGKLDSTFVVGEIFLLRKLLFSTNPSMITIAFTSNIKISKNISLNYNYSNNSLRIVHKGVDKNSAFKFLLNYLKIKVNDVGYVGNELDDYPILLRQKISKSVFVGKKIEMEADLLSKFHYIENPKSLGSYLLNLYN